MFINILYNFLVTLLNSNYKIVHNEPLFIVSNVLLLLSVLTFEQDNNENLYIIAKRRGNKPNGEPDNGDPG